MAGRKRMADGGGVGSGARGMAGADAAWAAGRGAWRARRRSHADGRDDGLRGVAEAQGGGAAIASRQGVMEGSADRAWCGQRAA